MRKLLAALAATALLACAKEQAHDAMPEIFVPQGADYTKADVEFMQGMIHHHGQALVMAAMSGTHGAGERVALLSKKIAISQRDEINLIKTWLTDRGQAAPDLEGGHTMLMPGMLTAEQLKELDAARGASFDKLFLTFMIQHHEGAVAMVNNLFGTAGSGEQADLHSFANDVSADQLAEIDLMRIVLSSSQTPGSR